jgi:hypothetical protein
MLVGGCTRRPDLQRILRAACCLVSRDTRCPGQLKDRLCMCPDFIHKFKSMTPVQWRVASFEPDARNRIYSRFTLEKFVNCYDAFYSELQAGILPGDIDAIHPPA